MPDNMRISNPLTVALGLVLGRAAASPAAVVDPKCTINNCLRAVSTTLFRLSPKVSVLTLARSSRVRSLIALLSRIACPSSSRLSLQLSSMKTYALSFYTTLADQDGYL